MTIAHLGKGLISIGALLILIGALMVWGPKVPFLSKLGQLPGDIKIEGKNFTFYFPWVTSILLSLVLTLIALFFERK